MRRNPPGKTRFLFVLEYFHPHVGGVETFFANLGAALAARGHAITVVTASLPGAPRRETWRGIDIVRIPTPSIGRRYFFTLFALPASLRLARESDLIHTTTYNAALPAFVAGLLSRKSSVITVHEVFGAQWHQMPGMNPLLGWGYRIFEWSTLKLPFDRYLCPSRFTRDRLVEICGIDRDKTHVVYPGIDYQFWEQQFEPSEIRQRIGVDSNAFLYLYFGRPGVSKGLEYLIHAAAIVSKTIEQSRLVLILSRSPKSGYSRVRRLVDTLGLGDHVSFVESAPREDLARHLVAADCIVTPSISEGFGYSAIEAAVVGRPVVAASGHATEEVMPDSALFVPGRDSKMLADAIIQMARSPRTASPPPRYEIEASVESALEAYRDLGVAV